jgi:hypothetical protein
MVVQSVDMAFGKASPTWESWITFLVVCNLQQQSICVKCFKTFERLLHDEEQNGGERVINWMKSFKMR